MDAGLAAAAGERLGTAEAWADVEPGVGEAAATGDVAGALGVNVRVAADDGVAVSGAPVVAAGGDALAETVGAGDAPDSVAHARESKTPGAAPQTDLVGVIQELPSAAVRESDSRMNG